MTRLTDQAAAATFIPHGRPMAKRLVAGAHAEQTAMGPARSIG